MSACLSNGVTLLLFQLPVSWSCPVSNNNSPPVKLSLMATIAMERIGRLFINLQQVRALPQMLTEAAPSMPGTLRDTEVPGFFRERYIHAGYRPLHQGWRYCNMYYITHTAMYIISGFIIGKTSLKEANIMVSHLLINTGTTSCRCSSVTTRPSTCGPTC